MPRRLLVTADDFGIGPATSRGILDLAERGAITSTVLLVNSPYAEDAVAEWNRRGRPVELGWHPCLTLDVPLAAPATVPSLVDRNGKFLSLGAFLKRLFLKRINAVHVERELRLQYLRFISLTGHEPLNINAHHHIHVFNPVSSALMNILNHQTAKPYLRRVVEFQNTLINVRGARLKRLILSQFGKRMAREFPGCDTLLGVTDPHCVKNPDFLRNWLRHARGDLLELTCHPGHFDETLIGRDGTLTNGQIHRRPAEYQLLNDPSFLRSVAASGMELMPVSGMMQARTLAA